MIWLKRKKYTDIVKVINVTKSCIKAEQCDVAINYVAQYIKYHEIKKEKYLHFICFQLLTYLIDTREHAKLGYHKPEWNKWQTVRTYPDINRYLYHLIGTRLVNM